MILIGGFPRNQMMKKSNRIQNILCHNLKLNNSKLNSLNKHKHRVRNLLKKINKKAINIKMKEIICFEKESIVRLSWSINRGLNTLKRKRGELLFIQIWQFA